MFCKNCGNEIGEGKKFCTNCGMPANHSVSHVAPIEPTLPNSTSGAPWWSKGLYKWLAISIGVAVLIALILIYYPKSKSENLNIQQSVVDILCDTGYGGSGTIFTTDGTILTNNHVIEGATICQVTIPDPATGGISEVYNAAPVIVPKLSKKYDVATLKIDGSYTDSNGKTWGIYPTTFQAFSLPSKCDPSSPSKLGDSVRIYGYPVTSGGYNLTITDGVISSFADDGNILTSAQIDSGNSGGLAVDQNGCWLGIPSAVVSGNYQNLGVIIPGDIVEALFLNSVTAKVNPAAANESAYRTAGPASTPEETNAQKCQSEFGIHSEWSGQVNDSGNPTCGCETGYSWDATGNACATKTSLKQECKSTFGSGSYSYTQSGKAVCGCLDGYQFNNAGTSCVVIPVEPVVTPVSSVPGCVTGAQFSATTGLSCSGDGSCSTGLFLDKKTGVCVTPIMYCMQMYGAYAAYNSVDNSCGCAVGYILNSNNLCAVQQNGYQVCSSKYSNATWDGTYNANGGFSCVCRAGYTWSDYLNMCY